jgi:hypothetical protein
MEFVRTSGMSKENLKLAATAWTARKKMKNEKKKKKITKFFLGG